MSLEWVAIALGFGGSLHCVLMCSPLAMAVTSRSASAGIQRVVYNGGRILTYGVLGSVVTSFGAAVNLSGFQYPFTIAVGLTLILMGVAGLTSLKLPYVSAGVMRFTNLLKSLFGKFLQRKTSFSVFVMGMLNGLLPCGLTYLALTYCLTLAGPLDGFIFMLLFGLGTLPAMLGFTSGIGFILQRFNLKAVNVTRYGFIVLGLIVFVRLLFANHQALDHAGTTVGIMFCQ
jgi:uncharacterized protein